MRCAAETSLFLQRTFLIAAFGRQRIHCCGDRAVTGTALTAPTQQMNPLATVGYINNKKASTHYRSKS
ncbi:hypothetical protein HC026_03475 [Lactobacillus sp. LC28-10]|uniref:Secreted protein n=1 Tax=Secundilactobacillus angelensis TaxID=2722706 RepID=A0ABX1KXL9_9LACO|nr:hypothetical protein [Secundilactobacillus angelensis]MCH5461684.1 hypothetical protein [Secundilactobacillus angelensis]NLR17980.1 hypothetical protein [Secundilactobacillus angelensis]